MNITYEITGKTTEPTRLILPDTRWSTSVLTQLEKLGYNIKVLGVADGPDDRTEAELARRDALLAETGL